MPQDVNSELKDTGHFHENGWKEEVSSPYQSVADIIKERQLIDTVIRLLQTVLLYTFDACYIKPILA